MQIHKIILTFTLVTSTMTMSANVLTETPQKSERTATNIDVNNDGKTDTKDIDDLAAAIMKQELTPDEIAIYDINKDNKVTITDLVKAVEILTGSNPDTTPGISHDPYNGEACAKKHKK